MGYYESNARGRERLRKLVERLTEANLAQPVADGWTVAAILAHLAFWDYRLLGLIERWQKEGIGSSPIDIDSVNEAMKPLCRAIPGRQAASLALQAAKAVDAAIENLPDELRAGLEELERQGKLHLDRSLHRDEHLDQIERALT